MYLVNQPGSFVDSDSGKMLPASVLASFTQGGSGLLIPGPSCYVSPWHTNAFEIDPNAELLVNASIQIAMSDSGILVGLRSFVGCHLPTPDSFHSVLYQLQRRHVRGAGLDTVEISSPSFSDNVHGCRV